MLGFYIAAKTDFRILHTEVTNLLLFLKKSILYLYPSPCSVSNYLRKTAALPLWKVSAKAMFVTKSMKQEQKLVRQLFVNIEKRQSL